MIRSGNMNDAHIRIVDQYFVASVAFPRSKLLCLALPRLFVATSDSYDVNETQSPHCIDMMRSDESRADNSHPDSRLFFHARDYSSRFSGGKASFPAPAGFDRVRPSSMRSDTAPSCRPGRQLLGHLREDSSLPAESGCSLPF